MMGRLNHEQEQFFYSFRLDEVVPEDHAARKVAAVLDRETLPYFAICERHEERIIWENSHGHRMSKA
jgi:hypothetical protein